MNRDSKTNSDQPRAQPSATALPPVDSGATEAARDADVLADRGAIVSLIGTSIGPYRILQKLGDAGLGSVYQVQQRWPIVRLVAIKVVKVGMDSVAVIARFNAERQALAMMDHANIAKVFDAGTTTAGATVLRDETRARRADHD